jgi:DNA-binding NarL/FixJ family response regulator
VARLEKSPESHRPTIDIEKVTINAGGKVTPEIAEAAKRWHSSRHARPPPCRPDPRQAPCRAARSGLTAAAIAERTGLSKRTVLHRLAAIMKKGGAISKSGISVRS